MPAASPNRGVGTLVVGASQAGVQVAATLREHGYEAPVTLVGDEARAPYQRPPLSKTYLTDLATPPRLDLRSEEYYDANRIDLVRGEHVQEVRLLDKASGSGTAFSESGRRFDFERLVIATGARPRRLDVPGADLSGVCYLRDLEDANDLVKRLSSARHLTVAGGGFVGLEVASQARAAGIAVDVIELDERLLARAVARPTSDFYRRAHERRGTRVHLGTAATEIEGRAGRVAGVRLADGRRLPTDLVLVGVGATPATELGEQLGLLVSGGIVVDAGSRTSIPSVLAAGDCTTVPHPASPTGTLRLESVQNAVGQGRQAAFTILGRPDPMPAVPWFWSDQFDLKLQIAGLQHGHDRLVLRGEPDSEQFSVLYFRGDQILAIDAVNSPIDYMTVRKALSTGVTIDSSLAHEPGIPLARLLTPTDEQEMAPAASS